MTLTSFQEQNTMGWILALANKIENDYASSLEESRGEYLGSLGDTENSKAKQNKPTDTS